MTPSTWLVCRSILDKIRLCLAAKGVQTVGGQQLAPEVAARRLCIAAGDLPGIGHAWTAHDVVEAQRDRPDWLRCARKVLGAARAEEQRQRKTRMDAVRLRQAGFEYPAVDAVATDFAHSFTRVNLLEFLYSALDASSAQTYVVDSGFDVSTRRTDCRGDQPGTR